MSKAILPSGWNWMVLGEVARWGSGGTPSRSKEEYYGGEIPWIKTGELNDSYIFDTAEKLSEIGLTNSSAKLFPAESIAVAMYGATIGKLGILGVEASCNQACAIAIPSDKLHKMYLFYYLKASKENLIKRGQGGAQPNISQEIIKSFPIPVPPLQIQEVIASALSEAGTLIQKRKEAITKLDELVQSVFLEMFGDPVTNVKKWEVKQFGEVLQSIDSGWSPKCDDSPVTDEESWGVLKLSSVTKGVYLPRENKELFLDTIPDKEIEVKNNDLLFTRKNTRELVGACAYVFDTPRNLMMPDTIFRFNFKSEKIINKLFLWGLFNNKIFKQLRIQKLAEGSAGSMPNISKRKLGELLIMLPPIEEQCKYASIVNEINDEKKIMQQQLAKLEESFRSLLHQAFTGQLQFREAKVNDYNVHMGLDTKSRK